MRERPPSVVYDFSRISGYSIVGWAALPLLESEIQGQEGCELSGGRVVFEISCVNAKQTAR